ncbi:MAG TPA: ABC transporter permease subunit [Gemmatimonadaceae bacterium]|nr:ABC transporter permease subunit [Gemmatimonadaceae bacterium]
MNGRLFARRSTVVGLAIVVVLGVVALLAPWLAPHDPALMDPGSGFAGPSAGHWLGTDNLGRDLLSRLVYGARWSLGLVLVATLLIMTAGVAVGVAAGYVGGIADDVLMRLADTILSVPSLLLGLAIVGTLGPGLGSLMIGLASIWWVGYARVVRGLVLALRERPFIDAARALGATDRRIVVRHILPSILPSVAVLASLEMGELVLAISGLSFLGLGAQPPTPEWGAMLNDGRTFFFTAPQLLLYPGLTISMAVMGFNLLGDGLRDALDPMDAARLKRAGA